MHILVAQKSHNKQNTSSPCDGVSAKLFFISETDNLKDHLNNTKADILFIDEAVNQAVSFCRTAALQFPDLPLVIMLNHNNSKHIKKFIQIGINQYFVKTEEPKQLTEQICEQSRKILTQQTKIPPPQAKKGLIIADASENIDIRLRMLLSNAGFRIYEASNITETAYFIKNKNNQNIFIDQTVLDKNSGFIKSLISLNQKLKIIISSAKTIKEVPKKNIQILYTDPEEEPKKVFNQIDNFIN